MTMPRALIGSEEHIDAGGTQFIASATTNVLSRSVDPFCRPSGYALSVNGVAKGGVGYAYDEDGLVSRLVGTNAAGRTFEVEYDNADGYNYGHRITVEGDDDVPFQRPLTRDRYRRHLVTSSHADLQGGPLDGRGYEYDALGRTTVCTDTTNWLAPSVYATYAYNDRSEVVSATIGDIALSHAYDAIGNHVLFAANAVTNTFTHNQVNQMAGRGVPDAPPTTTFTYTPDGGLVSDGAWTYAYDAEDQLVSVTSASLTNGALRVLNSYDYRRRRVGKTVERYVDGGWRTTECRAFVYDGWNLIHETVHTVGGGATNVTEIQYFWGPDLSGTLQGAGGVGGLVAVSLNGQFRFPIYDNNGNVVKYADETGNVVAAYAYDDFGRAISQDGSFRHRFSTKYYDPETDLYCYGYRFYSPALMRWLNRDPIGEEGGSNLYAFCGNNPIVNYDDDGCAYFAYRPLDIFLFKKFVFGNKQDEIDNTMAAHEQLFFEDGGIPANLGFFDDNRVRIDTAGIAYRQPHSKGWNDCIMRKAVAAVRPRPYSLLGNKSKGLTKYNCQDWAAEVRRAYYVIQSGGTYHPWGYTEIKAR